MYLSFYLFIYEQKAATFDVTDFYGDERTMEVNLSLSLQKKVTCNRIITMSCDIAGIKYDVGTLAITDECSFKGKLDIKVTNTF